MATAEDHGFHLVEHSDCDNCEKEDAWSWLRHQGRAVPKKLCWNMNIVTKFGAFTLPFDCKFYQLENQICDLDFSKTDLKGKLNSK